MLKGNLVVYLANFALLCIKYQKTNKPVNLWPMGPVEVLKLVLAYTEAHKYTIFASCLQWNSKCDHADQLQKEKTKSQV